MDTANITDSNRDAAGRFVNGNSARAQKAKRVEAMARAIASEFEGGFDGLTVSDRIALEKACGLFCGHPKRHDVEVRAINSGQRIISGLRRRLKPKKKTSNRPSMAELMANARR